MGRSIVGVDIGTESIRAVEVSNARTKPVVNRFHEAALPDGAVKNGEVVEAHTVAEVIKHLWSTGGFASKDVVLGVGNPKVLVRDLTVPRLSRKEIRAALAFQVQDILPVPVADALLDFYPIAETESDHGPVVNGLLVAAVKDSIAANLRAVQLAGLNPVGMDIIPFALNRVLVRGAHLYGTTAMIDVGAATTNVVIVSDGVPQFVRIIPAGGIDVSKAMVGRMGIAVEQAELGKRQLGYAPANVAPEHAEAASIIREVTGDLLNSLRNTLSFFVNSRPGKRIDRVQLSGGGSQMTNFAAALAELTRLPVELDSPFASITMGKRSAKSSAAREHMMSVALGLALGSAA